MLTVAGAVGGALLTIISGSALEAYKAHIALEQDVRRSNEERQMKARAATLDVLKNASESYDDLGDLPRRAAEYVENGKEGRPEDVRTVYRHFSRFMRTIRTHTASAEDLTHYYGIGIVAAWGERFTQLGYDRSVVSGKFSNLERSNFCALGTALSEISDIVGTKAKVAMVKQDHARTNGRRAALMSQKARANLAEGEPQKESPILEEEAASIRGPVAAKPDIVTQGDDKKLTVQRGLDRRITDAAESYAWRVKGNASTDQDGRSASYCRPTTIGSNAVGENVVSGANVVGCSPLQVDAGR